jgi:O-succinylbenzoic acid--CoA ligase
MISSPLLGSVPHGTVEDIALFFAAWRLGKAVYPLSFRIPEKERLRRFQSVKAIGVTPSPANWEHTANTINPNQVATLLETSSGTKIACHTLAAHLASAIAVSSALKITSSSRYGLLLPLFHVSGIAPIIRTFINGGHLLLKKEVVDATHLSVVSTQLFRFDQKQLYLPNLTHLLVGGGPLPYQFKDLPYPIYTSYGMTEAASTITIDGKILPQLKVELKQGEILLKGSSMMQNYWGGETLKGWFSTGNSGELIDGKLDLLGRLDKVFISGGEKIQPEVVEKVLLSIEGVSQARVFPVDDFEFGQIPAAEIETKHDLPFYVIKKVLEKELPRYMIPKQIKKGNLGQSKLSKMS